MAHEQDTLAKTRGLWRGVTVVLSFCFPFMAVPGSAATVDVQVTGVGSAQGLVQAQVCERAEWLKDCVRAMTVPAQRGVTILTFTNVPPGTYAVVAFHDINGNGKVDQNFLGIPVEGVGFSRRSSIPLAEPSFESAALRVEGQHVVIPVRLFFEP